MKGTEKLLLIGNGNADAAILNKENRLAVQPFQSQLDRVAFPGIFHGIRQQVVQNVAQ